ncbi:MAG: hypothetical protein R3F17_04395 [Planctomycetota bacterium]
MHTAGTVWVLHGGSELRLDSAARKATHFYAGDLAVAGPFECFTSLGVLRSKDDQARCELSLRDGTLRVSCLAGSARWTDALGQVELTAGESLER